MSELLQFCAESSFKEIGWGQRRNDYQKVGNLVNEQLDLRLHRDVVAIGLLHVVQSPPRIRQILYESFALLFRADFLKSLVVVHHGADVGHRLPNRRCGTVDRLLNALYVELAPSPCQSLTTPHQHGGSVDLAVGVSVGLSF